MVPALQPKSSVGASESSILPDDLEMEVPPPVLLGEADGGRGEMDPKLSDGLEVSGVADRANIPGWRNKGARGIGTAYQVGGCTGWLNVWEESDALSIFTHQMRATARERMRYWYHVDHKCRESRHPPPLMIQRVNDMGCILHSLGAETDASHHSLRHIHTLRKFRVYSVKFGHINIKGRLQVDDSGVRAPWAVARLGPLCLEDTSVQFSPLAPLP